MLGVRPARRVSRATTWAAPSPSWLGMDHLPGATVNRYCSSALQTTRMAFHAIKAGEGDVFISAGVETVSRFANGMRRRPCGTEPGLRRGRRRAPTKRAEGGAETWVDPRTTGELPDLYIAMGQTAENVAQLLGMSRAGAGRVRRPQPEPRREGDRRTASGPRDITPVTLPDGTVVSTDDGPRAGITLEARRQLKPVFRPDGTVTAGNCCPLNDGAAALVVMCDTKAKRAGPDAAGADRRPPAVTGLSPEIMGLGPVEASRQALAHAGMAHRRHRPVRDQRGVRRAGRSGRRSSSASTLDKLNVNGGAIAVGHPFGMTGARITTTLINSLQWHDKQFGLETMCVGGGMGMAMVLERLS